MGQVQRFLAVNAAFNIRQQGIIKLKAEGLTVSVNGGCVNPVQAPVTAGLRSWKPRPLGRGAVTSKYPRQPIWRLVRTVPVFYHYQGRLTQHSVRRHPRPAAGKD